MKIYDIRLLRTTTGKEHICFFYKTLPKKRINETIDIFKRNVGLIVNNQINDVKIKEYISEEVFIKIMKMEKVSDNKIGKYNMKLYRNNEIWMYRIENISDINVDFKDCDILLDRSFFINNKNIKYVIIKNNMGV
ncbi:hypothetical protein JMUB3935_0245 [Leptotrichia trevisanii]|uniref:Uncharacterized protein n=1 Tax=Leptotrichia trevisanii TaxID=109328 RepID=A0A510KHW3_9FUSO|nr:hypothetical protein [Leptotrichia trevisanii]BBM44132.1 hypothetical protein JMUB3870_0239 [Leptotrichia trevisanii]BBM51278.1 hypothetical protein JMUB3935_0245 [Leptotrichia trevisanii]